ncbi:MAG: hypothetical protein ACO1OB_09535 [Archangium sp.]
MFKKLLVGAALTVSSFAFAGPMHGSAPIAPAPNRAPPPPAAYNEVRSDRFDVQQGYSLLRSYDTASARRDARSLSMLDGQIANFINAELNESRREGRFDRRENNTARQLTNLQNKLSRLYGRYDVRSVNTKRSLLSDAVNIAERDLRDARQDRRDDRFARR